MVNHSTSRILMKVKSTRVHLSLCGIFLTFCYNETSRHEIFQEAMYKAFKTISFFNFFFSLLMDKCMLYVDIGRWRFFKKAQALKLKIRQARNIIHPRSQATGAPMKTMVRCCVYWEYLKSQVNVNVFGSPPTCQLKQEKYTYNKKCKATCHMISILRWSWNYFFFTQFITCLGRNTCYKQRHLRTDHNSFTITRKM